MDDGHQIGPPPRRSKIDAYLPFIRQTLESFPTQFSPLHIGNESNYSTWLVALRHQRDNTPHPAPPWAFDRNIGEPGKRNDRNRAEHR